MIFRSSSYTEIIQNPSWDRRVNTQGLFSLFYIISEYEDDLNITGTLEGIKKASSYLESEFKMKDLGKTKYCLSLQLEHVPEGILVHQSTYTQKVLERFGFEKAYPSKVPMVGRSLQQDKDPYRPREEGGGSPGTRIPILKCNRSTHVLSKLY